MWKEKGINKYPEISLSDFIITNIEKREDDIVVNFGEDGFNIKDPKQKVKNPKTI